MKAHPIIVQLRIAHIQEYGYDILPFAACQDSKAAGHKNRQSSSGMSVGLMEARSHRQSTCWQALQPEYTNEQGSLE